MFKLRASYPKSDPANAVIKLILNSAYGKTALRASETTKKMIQLKDLDKYVARNYLAVHKITKLEKFAIVDIDKNTLNHFNRAHCGSLILSMSKRIMNEVMCLAEDKGFKIMYQDTDSMHIFKSEVKPLAEAFEEMYGRKLIGEQLGQFHSDFAKINKKDTWAISSIFLGKKSYVDKLTNEDGEIEYHIRMKGIPSDSIRILGDVEGIYTRLFNGESITFNLTDAKTCFKKEGITGFTTQQKVTRTVQFN